MSDIRDRFWAGRLEDVATALQGNGFEACVVADGAAARDVLFNAILPSIEVGVIGFGGSMTLTGLGIMDEFKSRPGLRVIDSYDTSIPKAENIERRRQSLLSDLYITSSNAVTADGQLVNLDGTGNRVAALTFGPRHVVVIAGRNKVCANVHEAFERIRSVAAPMNTQRLNLKTPCVKTFKCEDCKSPSRICNTLVITRKSAPRGRTRVILVNQDLGF